MSFLGRRVNPIESSEVWPFHRSRANPHDLPAVSFGAKYRGAERMDLISIDDLVNHSSELPLDDVNRLKDEVGGS